MWWPAWLSDYDVLDTFASLRLLQRAGIRVHRQKHLKLHAKLILADGKRALLGSMNIDRSAFDLRRELGIRFDDEPIVERLSHISPTNGTIHIVMRYPIRWRRRNPDDELPHDPEFSHE